VHSIRPGRTADSPGRDPRLAAKRDHRHRPAVGRSHALGSSTSSPCGRSSSRSTTPITDRLRPLTALGLTHLGVKCGHRPSADFPAASASHVCPGGRGTAPWSVPPGAFPRPPYLCGGHPHTPAPGTPRLRASLAIGAAVPQVCPTAGSAGRLGRGRCLRCGDRARGGRGPLEAAAGRPVPPWMIPNDFVLRLSA
jgi:hypothetical protein